MSTMGSFECICTNVHFGWSSWYHSALQPVDIPVVWCAYQTNLNIFIWYIIYWRYWVCSIVGIDYSTRNPIKVTSFFGFLALLDIFIAIKEHSLPQTWFDNNLIFRRKPTFKRKIDAQFKLYVLCYTHYAIFLFNSCEKIGWW